MLPVKLYAAALCCLTPFVCQAQGVSYLSIEVSGALGTYPMALNNAMTVTGYYLVSPSEARGFVRQADGKIATFNVPYSLWTEPESINEEGDITGFYEVVAGVPRGFARYADGRLVTSEPAGGGQPNGPQAQPISINTYKVIAGNYPYPLGSSAGFTRSADGDFTTFAFGEGADYPTVVTGLNASGTVVGYVAQGGGADTGFFRHPDGFSLQFSIPLPGENNRDFNFSTIADSVNAEGTITGWYVNCREACLITDVGGYVRSPQGRYTLFSPPGTLLAAPVPGFPLDGGSLTVPHWLSINRDGCIAGSYTDEHGRQHAFVRDPEGTIDTFDPPKGMTTTATAINDDGVIAGTFHEVFNPQVALGFLRMPKPDHPTRHEEQ
jgi:hypothetical protein